MSYTATYELLTKRDEDRNSDKFYRSYVLHNSETGDWRVLFNWGRNGTNGQFQVVTASGKTNAVMISMRKIDSKLRAGYTVVSNGEMSAVADDLLDHAGVNVRSQPPNIGLAERISIDSDRAIRLLTGPKEVQVEAIALAKSLRVSLDLLRKTVLESEGRVDLVQELLASKVG
jgi:predicted DNA-binding WGR domain protein